MQSNGFIYEAQRNFEALPLWQELRQPSLGYLPRMVYEGAH